MTSCLILGAGNFGAAAALSLIKRGDTDVTLVDSAQFPNPRAASHDVNKIVRDDYPDGKYMNLLKQAMPIWRNQAPYKAFYHEVGMLRADRTDHSKKALAAYEKVGIDNACRLMPVEEVRHNWNGAFATANLGDLTHVFYNPNAGFAEADKALGAVIQTAVDAGVKYVVGEATKLVFGADGRCTGIALQSGEELLADRVLLATGARTATFLTQSAPENTKLHCGNRVVATGAVSFKAKLHGEQKQKFAPIPVFKNCLPDVKGEGMSILKDGTIKFNCDLSFTNNELNELTGEVMSIPPNDSSRNVWTEQAFSHFFEERARRTMKGLYGDEVTDIQVDSYRMCWDASTPTHDFLITPHPHSANLYIATGGSFHGWKFLPVIGDYVVAMMEGKLSQEYADLWSWDHHGDETRTANPTYQIVGDLRDVLAGRVNEMTNGHHKQPNGTATNGTTANGMTTNGTTTKVTSHQ